MKQNTRLSEPTPAQLAKFDELSKQGYSFDPFLSLFGGSPILTNGDKAVVFHLDGTIEETTTEAACEAAMSHTASLGDLDNSDSNSSDEDSDKDELAEILAGAADDDEFGGIFN